MSIEMNISETIANHDALVAKTLDIVTDTKVLSMEEQEALLLKQIEEEEAAKAKRMADLETKLAQVKAENAKALADAAAKADKGKAKDKPKEKPAATTPQTTAAERLAKAIETAKAAGQTMLPTDIALGVIHPKHLTDADKFLLELVAKERTKLEKLKDQENIPGTFAKAIFSFFYHCNTPGNEIFTQESVNNILTEALTRNVISKLYIPTTQGPRVLYFDAQWRPNLKGQEFERIPESEVKKAQKLFSKLV